MAKKAYIGVGGVAHKVKKIYIGVTDIYFEGEAENDGSGELWFGYGGNRLVAGGDYYVVINGTTYSGFTATFYPEEGWHLSNGTFTVNIEAPIQGESGSVYIYDSAGRFSSASTLSMKIRRGGENVARKVMKGYIGVGGVARPFWTSEEVAYFGATETAITQRSFPGGASFGSYALFAGGTAGGGYLQGLDAFDSSLVHTRGNNISQARMNLVGATVGDYALFAGGENLNVMTQMNKMITTVDSVDTSLTTGVKTGLSNGRVTTGVTVGGHALFGGGYDITSVYNKVDAYDTSLTKSVATTLNEAKVAPAAAAGNYALFAGGSKVAARWSSNVTSSVDVYDSNLTKSMATSLSTERCDAAAVSLGNYALFAGGVIPATNTLKMSATDIVEAFDGSLTRIDVSALSKARHDFAGTRLGSFAVFGGGRVVNGGAGLVDVDVYDSSLTKSTTLELSEGRLGHAAASVGNFALFACGSHGTSYGLCKTVEAFTV